MVDMCSIYRSAGWIREDILSYDLKICFSSCSQDWLIPLLCLIEFSFDLRKLLQYARVPAVSRSYTASLFLSIYLSLSLPLSFYLSISLSVFHCVESCCFFVPHERDFIVKALRRDSTSWKTFQFSNQASSESNATPYNSIRRRRKKCKRKMRTRVWIIWSKEEQEEEEKGKEEKE